MWRILDCVFANFFFQKKKKKGDWLGSLASLETGEERHARSKAARVKDKEEEDARREAVIASRTVSPAFPPAAAAATTATPSSTASSGLHRSLSGLALAKAMAQKAAEQTPSPTLASPGEIGAVVDWKRPNSITTPTQSNKRAHLMSSERDTTSDSVVAEETPAPSGLSATKLSVVEALKARLRGDVHGYEDARKKVAEARRTEEEIQAPPQQVARLHSAVKERPKDIPELDLDAANEYDDLDPFAVEDVSMSKNKLKKRKGKKDEGKDSSKSTAVMKPMKR